MAVDDVVARAAQAIRAQWPHRPRCGVILGTGLGGVAEAMERQAVLPYEAIAGWPRCTAPGHAGRFVCGTLANVSLVAIDGRFHAYEGRSFAELVLPVQLLAALGVDVLIVSNAAGGLNPRLATGDLVVLSGHVNLLGRNRFLPGMATPRGPNPYDPELRRQALALARREQIPAVEGTYVAVAGPNYETRAEYRLLRRIGADVVGMSTVPEVLAASRLGLRTLALSVVTNVARPDVPRQTTSDEVVTAANLAAPRLCRLVELQIGALAESTLGEAATPCG